MVFVEQPLASARLAKYILGWLPNTLYQVFYSSSWSCIFQNQNMGIWSYNGFTTKKSNTGQTTEQRPIFMVWRLERLC